MIKVLVILTLSFARAAELARTPAKTAPTMPALSLSAPSIALPAAVSSLPTPELGIRAQVPAAARSAAPVSALSAPVAAAPAAPAAPAALDAARVMAGNSDPKTADTAGLTFDGGVARRAWADAPEAQVARRSSSPRWRLGRFASAAKRNAGLPLLALAAPAAAAAQSSAQSPDNPAVPAGLVLLALAVIVVKRKALGLTWRDVKSRAGRLFAGLGIGAGTGAVLGLFAAMIQDLNAPVMADTPMLPIVATWTAASAGLGAFFGYYKDARWVRAFGRFVAGALGGLFAGGLGMMLAAFGLFMQQPAMTDPSFMLAPLAWGAIPAAAVLGLSNVFRKSRVLNGAAMMTAASSLISILGGAAGLLVGMVWALIAGGDLGTHLFLPTAIASGIAAAIGLVVGFKNRDESWQDMLAAVGAAAGSSGVVTGMLTAEAAELATGRPINPAAIALGGALGAASKTTAGAVAGGLAAELIADSAPVKNP